ncbi:MAG: hypothetical protein ABIG95_05800 [Candidatus Woesearchaeota archaeon]
MIKLSYDEVVERIQQKSGLSRAEIEIRVDKKLKQLSGLISKEGAAHIVANQLGIKLIEQTSGKLKIKDLLNGMREVETVGKVIRLFPVRTFRVKDRDGQVGSLIIGDETGTIRVVMWGDRADSMVNITAGTIIKVMGAYVKENNQQRELHLGSRSNIAINPQGVTIDDIKETALTTRKKIVDLHEGDTNVDIVGTLVQLFEPRFYEVCPECNRRVYPKEGSFVCSTHNSVEPAFAYVLNLFLDDGSENIRVVCFRDAALKLLNIGHDEMLHFKENPTEFEDQKNKMLGNIIKFSGRTVKNEMFDRLEFIARDIVLNPDPEEEIKYLDSQIAKSSIPEVAKTLTHENTE